MQQSFTLCCLLVADGRGWSPPVQPFSLLMDGSTKICSIYVWKKKNHKTSTGAKRVTNHSNTILSTYYVVNCIGPDDAQYPVRNSLR